MLVSDLAQSLASKKQTLSVIESCTGGSIASACTDLPGSSVWFTGGVVTYTNEMKIQLGVNPVTIEQFGPVSQEVAHEMASAGLKWCNTDWCLSVTGIAGPSGGSADKPVGTVCFAFYGAEQSYSVIEHFKGDRDFIRKQATSFALQKLLDLIK